MSDPDYLLAKRIYKMRRKFTEFMVYSVMALLAVILLLADRIDPSFAPFGTGNATLMFGLTLAVLGLAPFVTKDLVRTWRSFSNWKTAFLKFSLITYLESTSLADADPRDRLVKAIIDSDPDYEDALTTQGFKENGEPANITRVPTSQFLSVPIRRRGKTITFDVIVGESAIPKVDKKLREKLKGLKGLPETVGRVIEGSPTLEDYKFFSSQLRQLLYRHSIDRAILVYTKRPGDSDINALIDYAKEKSHWPKIRFGMEYVPIDLVEQLETGYKTVVVN